MRVVSLIASATEMVCALGCQNYLVGRSHECDYPDGVKSLPACTEPKFDIEGSSRSIDDRVKNLLQDGLAVYRVFPETLDSLRPDLIITQTQCEVCAVSLRDVEAALECLLTSRPRVLALKPESLADVWADIERVAHALGHLQTGQNWVVEAQARLQAIFQRADALLHRPTVGCIEWIDPLMASGNWMPELVALAGGVNIFGEAGRHAPWLGWEDLVRRDPEILLILPCGFDIERTQKEMKHLTCRSEWPQLRSVSNRRVYLLDGNQYFNRPGPRLVESAEILAEIFHPETFDFGHQGSGWIRGVG